MNERPQKKICGKMGDKQGEFKRGIGKMEKKMQPNFEEKGCKIKSIWGMGEGGVLFFSEKE